MSTPYQEPQEPRPGHGPSEGHPHAAPPSEQDGRKSWFARHKILTGLLGAVLLLFVVGALSDEGEDGSSPAASTPTSAATAEEGTGSPASSPGSTAGVPAAEEDDGTQDDGTEDDAAADAQAGEAAGDGQDAAAEDPATEDEPAEDPATEDEAADEAGQAREDTSDLPGIGDSVAVGDFEVTVTGVEPGIAYVGPDGWGEEAQGQFVKVTATVTNNGTSAEYFHDSEQKLIDEQDREHSTSSASVYLDEGNLWLTQINPGNTATGVLLYDIPVDASPERLTLSSGFFSRSEVEVDLTN